MSIKAQWQDAAEAYLREFIKKNELSDVNWIGGDIGGNLLINEEHVMSMEDIRYDVDSGQPAGKWLEWSEYVSQLASVEAERTVNYRSYCQGARPYTESQMQQMISLHTVMEFHKNQFYSYIEELKHKKRRKGDVLAVVRVMGVGDKQVFGLEHYGAVRSACAKIKKYYGSQYETHKLADKVVVTRKK